MLKYLVVFSLIFFINNVSILTLPLINDQNGGKSANKTQVTESKNITTEFQGYEEISLKNWHTILRFLEGFVLFILSFISFFVPITEHATRLLLIMVPVVCITYLNSTIKTPYFTAANMWFGGIFIYLIFSFIEYLIAFYSVQKIRKEVNEKRKFYKTFVKIDEEEEPEADSKSSKTKTDQKDTKNETDSSNKQEKNELVVPSTTPADPSASGAIVRLPEHPSTPEVKATDTPGEEKKAPGTELAKAAPPQQPFVKRESKEKRSYSSEGRRYFSGQLIGDPDNNSSLGETLDGLSLEAQSVTVDDTGRDQEPETGSPSMSDLQEERRKKKQKKIEKALHKLNEKLHLMYTISYLPTDRISRVYYPICFVLFIYFFWLVYIM